MYKLFFIEHIIYKEQLNLNIDLCISFKKAFDLKLHIRINVYIHINLISSILYYQISNE